MKSSLTKKNYMHSWTIIGSVISLLVASSVVYIGKRYEWVPTAWIDAAIGLGTGNLLAIMLRLRTLRFTKEAKNG